MAQDREFVNGLRLNPPRENAPEFVKASGGINRAEMIEFLQSKTDEWINFDILLSQKGTWYAQVNNWKPNASQANNNAVQGSDINELGDDIPW